MTKDEFLALSGPEQLKAMKKALDYLSHDFQHQEIVEIVHIQTVQDTLQITVWEKGVDGENWPQFTDYYHQKRIYELKYSQYYLAEE